MASTRLQLLLTGNELMAGQTIDSNSAMIAEQLTTIGFRIDRKVTLGDDFQALVSEMDAMSASSDVLIVNGGLGPTVDDLTAQALATLAGVELQENAEARQHLHNWCEQRRIALNDANLKQALLPAGASLIPNPVGSAVGFYLQHNGCLIICTPGVPSELRGMLRDTLLTLISERFPGHTRPLTLRFQTFGLGESSLQQLLRQQLPDWPPEVELGFRAGLPQLEVKLSITDPDHTAQLHRYRDTLYELIGDYIIGTDSITLAEAVIAQLTRQSKRITTAESCTGGLVASALTEVAGASAAFEAGFVTYSNAMKSSMLGVEPELLERCGAVSEEVVRAMLTGAIERSGADLGIAVSGIAGPEGGTESKPVGTVWIAWGGKDNINTRCLQFNGSRRWFQSMVAATTLDLVRRLLLAIDGEPRYLGQRSAGKKLL